MSFTIRFAGPNDATDLVRLINGLAAYERLAHVSNPDAATLARQLEMDANPKVEALIAHDVETGKAVGFALFFANYSTFLTSFGLFLEDLFVEPEYRGRGMGLALLKELAGIAHTRGCKRLDWNVLDWNETAISFYEKIGAVPLSDWETMRLDEKAILRLSAR